jgi:hypothetical protein
MAVFISSFTESTNSSKQSDLLCLVNNCPTELLVLDPFVLYFLQLFLVSDVPQSSVATKLKSAKFTITYTEWISIAIPSIVIHKIMITISNKMAAKAEEKTFLSSSSFHVALHKADNDEDYDELEPIPKIYSCIRSYNMLVVLMQRSL